MMKINFDELSPVQQKNLDCALDAYKHKVRVSASSPVVLYIELTQNCLGACVYCKGHVMNDPKYNMTDQTFEILMKEYVPFAAMVDLRGWGESLLLPNLDYYIHRIAGAGCKIRITTTLAAGTEKIFQSLVDNDVYVSVSFDFAEKRPYERTRRGLDFDVVMRNLLFLSELMRKNGSLNRNLRLGVVPFQEKNLDQLAKIIKMADALGIKEVRVSPLMAAWTHPGLLKYHKTRTMDVLRQAVVLARDAGIELQLGYAPFKELYIKEKVFDCCCHPWLYGGVTYKGDFLYCDHLLSPRGHRYALGTIYQNKDAVWNGRLSQVLRRAHAHCDGHHLPDKCSACYKDGRYADHEHSIDSQFIKWNVTGRDVDACLR